MVCSVVAHLTSTYQPRAGETCMRVATAVSKALGDESSTENGARGELLISSGARKSLISMGSEHGCLCGPLSQRASEPLAIYSGPFVFHRNSKKWVYGDLIEMQIVDYSI